MKNALKDKAFWLILISLVCGLFGINFLIILPLSLMLNFFSVVSDKKMVSRFKEIEQVSTYKLFWLKGLAQKFVVISVTYLVGYGINMVFYDGVFNLF